MRAERVSWVGIQVTDLDRAVRFYRDVLGLVHVSTAGDAAHLATPDGGCRVELFALGRAGVVTADRAYGQPVVAGFEVEDFDTALAELRAAGARPAEPGEGQGSRWCHVQDPDGNWLEIKRTATGTPPVG